MIEKLKETTKIFSEWAIYGEIEEFDQFKELIKDLYLAEEGDCMLWKLNSSGGACDVGEALIAAMKQSKARIYCHVEANCYSMAAIIALCGHGLSFNADTYLMFHDYSTMYHGKGSEIEQHVDRERDVVTNMFKRWCCPFLTETEFKRMMSGEDKYIHWDDKSLPIRIRRHFK